MLACRRLRQPDLYEFKVILVYTVSTRPIMATASNQIDR